MCKGEEKRDASSKVRGYLYQDLVAIDELVEKRESVCLELLEDVFSIGANSDIRIIQAKYYPASNIPIKQVIRDLYYQHLKLSILEYEGNVKCQLIAHTSNEKVFEILSSDQALDTVKGYFNDDVLISRLYDVKILKVNDTY